MVLISPRPSITGPAPRKSSDLLEHPLFAAIPSMIREFPGIHRGFGPYWWGMKAFLKKHKLLHTPSGSSSFVERDIEDLVTTGDPISNAFNGLLYLYLFPKPTLHHFMPALNAHMVPMDDGTFEWYEVRDGDFMGQLDLFSAMEPPRLSAEGNHDPADTVAGTWLRRAEEYRNRDQLAEAGAAYHWAVLLSRESSERIKSWLLLAEVLEQLGQLSAAFLCYESCYTAENQPWLLLTLGKLSLDMGRLTQGGMLLRRASKHMPGNPELEVALARLKEMENGPRASHSLLYSA